MYQPICALVVIGRQAGDDLANRWICAWLGHGDAAGQGVIGVGWLNRGDFALRRARRWQVLVCLGPDAVLVDWEPRSAAVLGNG